MTKISILTSLYKAAPYIEEFHRRCRAAVEPHADAVEFIFVDDGCPAGSAAAVEGLAASHSDVYLIELARNTGQHRALMTGLAYATGDYVYVLDADLEEEPELFERLFKPLQAEEDPADMAYGVMSQRKGGTFERFSGALYFWLIGRMADNALPKNILAARVMSRRFAEALLQFPEYHVYLGGVSALAGFKTEAVVCAKGSRPGSAYTLRRKIDVAIDGFTSYSEAPVRALLYVGLILLALSGLATAFVFLRDLFGDHMYPSTYIALAALIAGGLNLTGLGVVGLYVARTFQESKRRPRAIVKRTIPAALKRNRPADND